MKASKPEIVPFLSSKRAERKFILNAKTINNENHCSLSYKLNCVERRILLFKPKKSKNI